MCARGRQGTRRRPSCGTRLCGSGECLQVCLLGPCARRRGSDRRPRALASSCIRDKIARSSIVSSFFLCRQISTPTHCRSPLEMWVRINRYLSPPPEPRTHRERASPRNPHITSMACVLIRAPTPGDTAAKDTLRDSQHRTRSSLQEGLHAVSRCPIAREVRGSAVNQAARAPVPEAL